MEILKIIEALQSYSEDVLAYKLDGGFANAVTEAVSLLISQGEQIADLENKLATVNGGWTPVTEHEPEIDCLTVDDLGQIVLAKRISVITLPTKQKIYLANDKAEEILACLGDGDTLINCTHITHWMPLPEPPKEVAHDE